jgi:hypothetical protein
MGHEGSLPCSQESAIGPYPESDAYRPHLSHSVSLRILYKNMDHFMKYQSVYLCKIWNQVVKLTD